MNLNKLKKQELISILAFVFSSASFMLFYFVDYQKNNFTKALGYLLPAIFWLGLIIAVVMQILISLKLKMEVTKNKIGVVSFFKNKYAVVFDVLMIVSIIITLILLVKHVNNFIVFLIISLLIISFEMHCILNGKYFNTVFLDKNNK